MERLKLSRIATSSSNETQRRGEQRRTRKKKSRGITETGKQSKAEEGNLPNLFFFGENGEMEMGFQRERESCSQEYKMGNAGFPKFEEWVLLLPQ